MRQRLLKGHLPEKNNMKTKNQKTAAAVSPADFVSTVPKWIESQLDAVLRILATRLERSSWRFDPATAMDLAAAGLEYALRPALYGVGTWPLTTSHLVAVAARFAGCRATDLYRKNRRQPKMVGIDEVYVDAEGEMHESRALEATAMDRFRAEQARRERAELGAVAAAHFEAMLDELNVSRRKRNIFIEAYLLDRPVAEVARKYGITRNYLYGIVFGVKAGLARVGPRYLKAV